MKKPSVYLDTNIISAYCYSGSDVTALARRASTREWWEQERQHFSIWVSATTIDELRDGRFRRQAECVRMANRIRSLPSTQLARELFDDIVAARVIPDTKLGDALQMAISAAHSVDYLLTWNYAHLANPISQRELESICRTHGLDVPLLVSPESIPQWRFGQTIRRRKQS